MENRSESTIWAYGEEVKQKGMLDFIKSHTSFLKPLHFHEGEMILDNDVLRFDEHIKGKGAKPVEIGKNQIRNVHLGFDDTFRRTDDRSLGLTLEPLRIDFIDGLKETSIYLFADHNRVTRTNQNKEWFEKIKNWSRG